MNFLDERLPPRFWDKVQPCPMSGCWLFVGASTRGGYGVIGNGPHSVVYAHRLAYEAFVGPIAEGLQIDHRCRVRCCCNPAHLEPVTPLVNVTRGIVADVQRARHAAQTHCKRGHLYDDANTYRRTNGRRACKQCQRDHVQEFRRRTSPLLPV